LKKSTIPAPDYEKGVEYWNNIEASVDGVLGGFGEGVSLPRLTKGIANV
jgi:protein N-terminal methyltransferase